MTPTGGIIVATDGAPAGDAAFTAAAQLASKLSATVRVVVVVEPLPVLLPQPSAVSEPLVASPELFNAVRDSVVESVRKLGPESSTWHVDVEYGRPSEEIVRKARDSDARLIITGLVHHSLAERILDGDTALDVVRQSDVPVLLVPTAWEALPSRAVFAIDFSEESIHAARLALPLLGKGAVVTLAHVMPRITLYDRSGLWEEEYESAAERELSKVEEALKQSADYRFERKLLLGNAAAALLQLGNENNAELIVAGTRGAGLVKRILVGSVATRLIRHSTCSLLIVPH